MLNCDKCLYSRPIVSENGIHYRCCLTPKQAAQCIYDGRHYAENPTTKEKEDLNGTRDS